jgi:hypothetical protein
MEIAEIFCLSFDFGPYRAVKKLMEKRNNIFGVSTDSSRKYAVLFYYNLYTLYAERTKPKSFGNLSDILLRLALALDIILL